MKLIERVYYSILGKPIKNLLLFLVVTLLGAFLSASFSIYQANKDLEKTVKEKLNPIIVIEWNHNILDNELKFDEEELLKEETIKKYRNDERISFVENRYLLDLNHIQFKIGEKSKEWKNVFPNSLHIMYNFKSENQGEYIIDSIVSLIGVDNYEISSIRNGALELKYGRIFTEEEITNGEKVFFNSYLQSEGKLENFYKEIDILEIAVSEMLSEYSPEYIENIEDYLIHFDYSFELKSIGGAKQVESSSSLKYHSKTTGGFGLIIPVKVMDEIGLELEEIYKKLGEMIPEYKTHNNFEYYGMKYLGDTYLELGNADMLDSFIQEIKSDTSGLIKEVYSYSDSYNDVQSITKSLNTIAIISLVVCMIASIIILSLIIQIFVHERRYEIGVFLSLGESRKKIILQIFLEILIVGILAISVSLFVGNMIGKTLSNNLLENQVEQYEKIENEMDFKIDEEIILDSYSVEITIEYVLCVYAGGIFVLVVSCIVPSRNILKIKPKKLLM